MGKTVNIGQLREPIFIVSKELVDDGLGGYVTTGNPVKLEVFSYWKQVSEGRKMYLGLDSKTNYFEVIIRYYAEFDSNSTIESNGKTYTIQKVQKSQNLGGPEMLTLTISADG